MIYEEGKRLLTIQMAQVNIAKTIGFFTWHRDWEWYNTMQYNR